MRAVTWIIAMITRNCNGDMIRFGKASDSHSCDYYCSKQLFNHFVYLSK